MRNRNRRWVYFWIATLSYLSVVGCHYIDSVEFSTSGYISEEIDSAKDSRSMFSPRMDYEQWKPLGRGDPLKNDPTYDYVPPVLDRVHYWLDPALRRPDPHKTEVLLLGVSARRPSSVVPEQASNRRDTGFLQLVDGPRHHKHRVYHHFQPSAYYHAASYNRLPQDQKMLYTVLMPPPAPVTSTAPTTTETTSSTISNNTPPSVTLQEANLIYQASESWQSNNPPETQSLNTASTPVMMYDFSPTTLEAHGTNHLEINYVTAPPQQEIMHKGHVSDGNLDEASKYVKIGKTEAKVQADGHQLSGVVPVQPPLLSKGPLMIYSKEPHDLLLTMQPPPAATRNPILDLLEKEKVTSSMTYPNTIPLEMKTTTMMIPTTTQEETTSTTEPTAQVPTMDPMLAQYMRPARPVKPSQYLIIQGHSKVKTYGPARRFHGIAVQDNEIPDGPTELIQSIRQGRAKLMEATEQESNTTESVKSSRNSGSGDLQTLKHVVLTGLGGLDLDDYEDLSETELHSGYRVVDSKDATSERYHKGIVEEARKLKL